MKKQLHIAPQRRKKARSRTAFLACALSMLSTQAQNSSIDIAHTAQKGHLAIFYSELAEMSEATRLTIGPAIVHAKKPPQIQIAALHPPVTAIALPPKDNAASGLISPLEKGILFSLFGNRCRAKTDRCELHNGVDIAIEAGTRIKAAHKGTVTVGYNPFLGHFIKIEDGKKRTEYGHLKTAPKKADGTKLRTGDKVLSGEVIGIVGASGNAEGPHLHFSLVLDGKYVDPLAHIKTLAALPAQPKYEARVGAIRARFISQLTQNKP